MRKLRKYLQENNYLIVLTVVTIIVGILHFATNDLPPKIWLKQSWDSLFITVIGIWITVLCIDQIIKRKEKREKDRLQNIAYMEISKAVNFYLFFMNRVYIASSKEIPELKETYREMYNTEHFREAFMSCNFTKITEVQNCSWGQFIDYQTKEFMKGIDNIIMRYSFVLDADILKQLVFLDGSSWILVYSHLEKPEGKREVIYTYYNDFLNRLFFLSESLCYKSENQKYRTPYDGDYWNEDENPFEKPGVARFDSNR